MVSTNAIFYNLFAVLTFVTPLIFVLNTNELFEFPKMFFVYIVGSIMLFLFALHWIYGRIEIKKPNIFAVIFVLANVISTIFSSHTYTSLWGYYTRFNGGLISVLIFFGIYFVALNTLSKDAYKKLLQVFCLSAVPIGIYAITQRFDLTPRVYSTFGQPNWLAAYMSMAIPITCIYILEHRERLPKFLWIFAYFVNFTALWFTYSVSGLLGFLLSMIAFVSLNKNSLKNNVNVALSLLFISILIAFLNPGIFKERVYDAFTDMKKFISTAENEVYAAVQEYKVSDTGAIRGDLWKGTLDLVFSKPKNILVGTGSETFPYEFQRFRPKELNYSSEWDFIFNKPHNYYLELLSNLGAAGLISYILLIKFSLGKSHKIYIPTLVAFFVTNIFGWPTVSSAFIFWLFLSGIKNDS